VKEEVLCLALYFAEQKVEFLLRHNVRRPRRSRAKGATQIATVRYFKICFAVR
jgi:hypothetical protein